MKYKINYGSRVSVIPESAIEALPRAGANDLKVLISLCAQNGTVDPKKLAKALSLGEDEVRESLSFWRGTGVIESVDGKEPDKSAEEETVSSKDAKKAEESPPHLRKSLEVLTSFPNTPPISLPTYLKKDRTPPRLSTSASELWARCLTSRRSTCLWGLLTTLSLILNT